MSFPSLGECLSNNVYLHLMSFASAETARAVERCAWAATDFDGEVVSAITQENWRPTMVGCAAALLATHRLFSRDRIIDATWSTLLRGSWASPQLAVTAFLLDPSFTKRAQEIVFDTATKNTKRLAAVGALLGMPFDDIDRGDQIALRWRDHVRTHATEAARACWTE